jgi:peptide/nickel transport system substrate-binding protein
MLREAGWFDGDGDGVRERAGESLSFTALSPPGAAGHAAIYVQAALQKVGVHMEIQNLDMNLLRGRVQNGEFEAAFLPYWNSVDGQIRWLAPGLDSGDGTPQQSRSGGIGYDNPEVARLLASVRETADADQEDSIYRNLAPLIRRDLPITFLYPELTTYIVHRRVRGLESPFRADPIQFLERLWIEE